MKKRIMAGYIIVLTLVVAAAWFGSRAVTAMTESAQKPNRRCIVIDAGHGGMDGGATSCTGELESTVNLSIAKRLDDLLHLLGYKTLMLRDSDRSLHTQGESIAQKKVSDLKERVRLTNETENAVLISIHQNHFPDGKYSGAQVFYASMQGSRELAELLQASFKGTLNQGSNRQCKQAKGIFLMAGIRCPGILVECGFLSNPREERLLRSSEYQQKICCVIASSLSCFLNP